MESFEKKEVEFSVSAEKCKGVQKSAQECEKKELEYVVGDEWRVIVVIKDSPSVALTVTQTENCWYTPRQFL